MPFLFQVLSEQRFYCDERVEAGGKLTGEKREESGAENRITVTEMIEQSIEERWETVEEVHDNGEENKQIESIKAEKEDNSNL